MIICSKCKIKKNESEFYKNKYAKNGLKSICKKCELTDRKKNYIHSERMSLYPGGYENNKERISIIRKEHYKKNKERIKKNTIKYYYENKEKSLKKQLEWQNKMGSESENYKLTKRIRTLFYNTLKNSNNNKYKKFQEYTGINIECYIEYFKINYNIEFSEITEKVKYHIDHIIPCSAYDFTDEEEIKKCWQPENLRLISAKENLKKHCQLDYDLIKKHKIEHLLPKKEKK